MISEGDVIRISYTAKLEDGTIVDTTDEEVAKKHDIFNENARYGDIYLIVGKGHVLPGLEEDIKGKEVGYKGTVEVPPEKAFGEYDPELKDTFSVNRFKERPEVGQRVRIGDRLGTVERIVGRRVIVDFNHPLAGKKIIFEYEIKEKLEKPEDKIKALFVIHTGVDTKDVKIEDGKAVVEVSSDAYLNQLFLIGRYRAVKEIFEATDVKEIEIIERFEREHELLKLGKEIKGEKSGEEESKESSETKKTNE
ncbi:MULTISPECIES: FKBP-type peptidyl-prolyl cis-trans isomerase [unclassified Archaeoglobus]|uniref:FKBP-type peptidyl-prolyl cis-trans isomerase n=1 Tax=unclassified Archaeoglobus TaxID=2643606 RepID=UPI0025C21358|nr:MULTISPECIES: peptidylprolyl isomerase [unclassified Archaeoglobus]